MISGPKQVLRLLHRGIKRKPALIIRVGNTCGSNARRHQPVLDRGDGFFGWCERFRYLFGSPVLAIVDRARVRAASDESRTGREDARRRPGYSHI